MKAQCGDEGTVRRCGDEGTVKQCVMKAQCGDEGTVRQCGDEHTVRQCGDTVWPAPCCAHLGVTPSPRGPPIAGTFSIRIPSVACSRLLNLWARSAVEYALVGQERCTV